MNWVVTTPAAARIPRAESRPFVSLLSDWGLRDPSAAIARAVVLNIVPDALIVDISHEVEKYNIRHGALVLWSALSYLPVGAHMAVIDPGVGTPRRPIAIETARGDYLVGPDNGLLLPGADRLGGLLRVHAIENTQYRLPVVSATFHGRDLFAPTAAHLAAGVPLEAIGPAIDARDLVGIDWPPVVVRPDELETTVIYHDNFGNLKLAGLNADIQDAIEDLRFGELLEIRIGRGRRRTVTLPWAADLRRRRSGWLAAVPGLLRPALHRPEPGQCRQDTGHRGGDTTRSSTAPRRSSRAPPRRVRGAAPPKRDAAPTPKADERTPKADGNRARGARGARG